MTRQYPSGLSILLISGVATLATPALAQDIAAAETLFTRGLADMEAGRYEKGCKALAESQRLDPRPGTLFTLAACEERWGHIATAMSRYGDYLDVYERLPADRKTAQLERPRLARAARDKLRPEVPGLTLVLSPNAPAGTIVKRDGQVVGEAALGVELPLDPGEHTVSTEVAGSSPWEQHFTLGRGEKKQLVLEVRAPARADAPPSPTAPPASPPSPPPAPPRPLAPVARGPGARGVAGFVIGGVGVAGLAAGAVMGGLALAKKSTVQQNCGTSIGQSDETACNRAGLDAVSAGRGLALGSSIGLGVGLAGVVTGVVLVVLDRAPASPATGTRARWLSAGIVPAGLGGAAAGVQGVW
jgi:hypothetical protein